MPPAEPKPRQTCLAEAHTKLGAKMVDFSGWSMPVHYSGILDEHHAVRTAAGLFDISHMGQVFVSGTAAEAWLNTMLTNDIRQLSSGEGQYTLLLNESGGILDDLLVYRLDEKDYLLVVNASRIEDDLAWLRKWAVPNADISHEPGAQAGLALQGPQAESILEKVFPAEFHFPKRNEILAATYQKHSVLISRTGYTGEDGFELFAPAETAVDLWNSILKEGAGRGCKPAGLGARDTLRLEASLPLYGHELSPTVTPLEAGLGLFTSFDKPEKFIGRDSLRQQKEKSLARKLAAFTTTGPGAPPRAGYPVLHEGKPIGEVTSGAFSPTLKTGIGFALLAAAHTAPGTPIAIEIRGNPVPASIAKRPLYKRPSP
jgi:aminomethyltransferase